MIDKLAKWGLQEGYRFAHTNNAGYSIRGFMETLAEAKKLRDELLQQREEEKSGKGKVDLLARMREMAAEEAGRAESQAAQPEQMAQAEADIDAERQRAEEVS